MTKKLPPEKRKNKARTKEHLLDKASKYNIDVDTNDLNSINDIASIKTKINNTHNPVDLNENRGGEREGSVISKAISDDLNADLLEHVHKYWSLPTAKTDEEIAQRIEFYFKDCYKHKLKPTLEGCALACGVTTETFSNWAKKDSKSDFDRFEISKRCKQLLATFDASLLINGKLNPVAYIFRAKNYYGMKDQTESVVKHESNLGETKSADELLKIIDADVVEMDDD